MSMPPIVVRRVAFVAAVAAALATRGLAQEVGFLDLTTIVKRTDFRRPPSSPNAGEERRGGSEENHESCSPSTGSMGSLRTALVSLDRTYYQSGDEPRFEVTVENVDSAPLTLPFSPHLADLQPADPAQKFSYAELQVVLWIASKDLGSEPRPVEGWQANTGGLVTLYGADDHPDTMVTLNQGEWVRIVGKGKWALPSDERISELNIWGRALKTASFMT
jgi:hypothetical protein